MLFRECFTSPCSDRLDALIALISNRKGLLNFLAAEGKSLGADGESRCVLSSTCCVVRLVHVEACLKLTTCIELAVCGS